MAGFISTLKSYIPNRPAPKATFGYTDTSQGADSYAWRIVKRYAKKFWNWFKDDNWRWVLITFVMAGIIHILAVLNLPSLAPKSAYVRLQNSLPVNTMKILNSVDEDNPIIPMLAPDVRYAICRYDLSNGPVTIKSGIPNEFFSIAAHDKIGQNFYIISGQALQRSDLYMVITQDKDTTQAEVDASEESDADDVIAVQSKDAEGIILLRAPVKGPSYANSVEAILSKATCQAK